MLKLVIVYNMCIRMEDLFMGFFKDIIGGDEPKVESAEEEFYSVSKEEYHQQNGMAGSKGICNSFCNVKISIIRVQNGIKFIIVILPELNCRLCSHDIQCSRKSICQRAIFTHNRN